jgi:uncharacterized OB-fold protein
MDSDKNLEQPCPNCGSRSYTWGTFTAGGLSFMPDNAWIWEYWRKLFQCKLPARRCDDCGNIQLFAARPRPINRSADPEF